MLEINTIAPDFTLADQEGKNHTLSTYRGQYVLLYFYPKDDTPGCTTEATTIRNLYTEFEKNKVKVLGVSADSTESHQKFAVKYNLPFTLLADTERRVITLYGADSDGKTKRISYLIDSAGKIVKIYPTVTPAKHGGEILEDMRQLKKT